MIRAFTVATFLLAATLAASPACAADPLDGVLAPYFRIQAQLAEDRTDTVGAEAAQLATAAAALGASAEPLAAAARKMAAADGMAPAREAFGEVSDALIAYVDASHAAVGAETARVYCPMIRKSWLQQGAQVRNPYFGKGMLGCGTIKKRG